jgi:hypothetical protein
MFGKGKEAVETNPEWKSTLEERSVAYADKMEGKAVEVLNSSALSPEEMIDLVKSIKSEQFGDAQGWNGEEPLDSLISEEIPHKEGRDIYYEATAPIRKAYSKLNSALCVVGSTSAYNQLYAEGEGTYVTGWKREQMDSVDGEYEWSADINKLRFAFLEKIEAKASEIMKSSALPPEEAATTVLASQDELVTDLDNFKQSPLWDKVPDEERDYLMRETLRELNREYDQVRGALCVVGGTATYNELFKDAETK